MRTLAIRGGLLVLLTCLVAADIEARRETAAAADAGLDARRLDEIQPVVQAAIMEKKLPGAVVLVGRGDKVAYQKAIGNRAVEPSI